MRIAVWYNLPSGGAKRALYYQVKGLVGRGHSVKVWTTQQSNQDFADVREFAVERVVDVNPPRKWNNLRTLGWKSAYNMVGHVDAMVQHCRICVDEIESEGFDFLFVHPCMQFRASAMGVLCKLPSAIYQQEPSRFLFEALPELPWIAPSSTIPPFWPLKRLFRVKDLSQNYALRIMARTELEWMKGFDRIFVNSSFSRESILKAYGLESFVNYLGIDCDLFKMASAERKGGYVIGLGSVSFGKGVDRAIEGIATIPSEIRPPLIWIGNYSDSAYMDRIKNLAMESGVQLECKLMVTDDELADLLSRASCMIYTSRLEPFGFAPLEANACGTAVVAIAEGGIRETVVSGVNGELIRSFDPKAIGNIVQSYTGSHDKARRVGLAAREHVLSNWSWEASVEELERELLATTRRRKKA